MAVNPQGKYDISPLGVASHRFIQLSLSLPPAATTVERALAHKPSSVLLLLRSVNRRIRFRSTSRAGLGFIGDSTMGSRPRIDPHDDGASAGKIFIGGLAKDTTYAQFNNHFGKYGEITDSVVMKDRHTGQPRGFGFITYADPSVVDKVIEDNHVINGKQVEIKRTIPKGSGQPKEFKTKKIFVGGIPSSVTDDELKDFFSKYGEVIEHQIIRDHETHRSRGFGFVIFKSEEVVDEVLSNGNMIDMAGTKVEIKKAEPKKPSYPPPGPAYGSYSRGRSFNDSYAGFGGPYDSFDGGYGPGPYRNHGGLGGRYAGRYGYGGGDYAGGYGLGGYPGEASLGYSSRFEPYGGRFAGGYGGGGLGGYARGGEGYGSYGGPGYAGGYDSGPGSSYGGPGAMYGRGGYSSSGRFHPYWK